MRISKRGKKRGAKLTKVMIGFRFTSTWLNKWSEGSLLTIVITVHSTPLKANLLSRIKVSTEFYDLANYFRTLAAHVRF